jgi:hypothetical protein
MEDILMRIVHDLIDRVSGPMHFRVFMQPAMATIFAVLAGLKDAKTNKPPYFWAIFTHPAQRRDMIREGWKQVGKIFILAVVLDVIYQYMVLHTVYPGEVIIVAFVLAIVPYLVLRGLVNRIASIK